MKNLVKVLAMLSVMFFCTITSFASEKSSNPESIFFSNSVFKPKKLRIWIRVVKETRDDGNGNTSTTWGLDAGACTSCRILNTTPGNEGIGEAEYDPATGLVKITNVELGKGSKIDIPQGANLKLTLQKDLASKLNSPKLVFETKTKGKLITSMVFSEAKSAKVTNKVAID